MEVASRVQNFRPNHQGRGEEFAWPNVSDRISSQFVDKNRKNMVSVLLGFLGFNRSELS